ncbi:beta-glucuronidase [Deinococcus reticulitermitis]|uniref:Beta-glucuronidase n=1 Tax=Deinococcus reticulitermitis TaxID=856736 RepID=A0A1H7CKM3_9DEIO|nr:beta-glucuronidase [Deinococcus reticulitermitis]SEJ89794.1 beta-glucuronidase [Deinococcus reticulitermitis]
MLYPVQNDKRNRLDLSGIWDFRTDPDHVGEAEGWSRGLSGEILPMAVPGSWNEQYADLFNYLDLSWYVRRTYVPSAWQGQRVMLRVGSAPYYAEVYVNGQKVGAHEGGHLPFEFDITDQVKWDEENTVAVSVENNLSPQRVPSGDMDSAIGAFASFPKTTYDFFPFAGLHRPVWLYSVPERHIRDVRVVTDLQGTDGVVRVTVHADAETGRLDLGDVGAHLTFKEGVAEAELRVLGARLWSDKDPYLYDLHVRTEGDHYSLKVGIRTVAVEGGKILLNGEPVQLNGFGRHEDFIASGKGLNLPLLVKDYQLMRWTGANAYRTSHYPYSEEEMMLADQEGFLIIDEIPAVSLNFENDENIAARLRMCQQQIEELIARDKNHPSVVMWCVANEPMPGNLKLAGAGTKEDYQDDPTAEKGEVFLNTLVRQAKDLDPTRPVTVVGLMGGPTAWLAETDVICINRYWGWYILGGQLDEARAGLSAELDRLWEQFGKPIIMTEFGADTMAGMHGQPPVMWTEEYQADYIRFHLEEAGKRDYVAGMQVWNFADFAAVQSIMRVGGLNMKGVFTRQRTPKMAAHVLREFWTKGK